MLDKDWKKFIQEKRREYMKIGHVECPAFGNEKIYFTQAGFNHLIRKERKWRDHNEQSQRLLFMQYAPGILNRSNNFLTHYTDVDEK